MSQVDHRRGGGGGGDQERRVKGSELFVGGMARSTTEADISQIFSDYGRIVELRLMKDQNGVSKGFCFVRFSTKEAASRAIKERDGTVLHGKRIGVAHSSDQDSLFLGNLEKEWSAEEFDELVRQAFRDVVSVELALPSNTGKLRAGKRLLNRGFGFVRFSSHAAAARAHRLGSQPDFMLYGSLHPVVDWAEEDSDVDPKELEKVKTAFVGNLPANADEEYLKRLFQPFGKIEKVALSRKGRFPVGFVHFVNRADLDEAIKELDGQMILGPNRGPDFKIQVAVAKPAEKDRKRANEDSNSRSLNTSGTRPDSLYDRYSRESKAPRLSNMVTEPVDPYEEAVIALPSAVKERLLRVLRLGIATRYDVDIQCIASLQVLPESAAIAVLDQFLISAGDRRDKGAYFASLIARHQADKFGSQLNSSYLQPKPSDFAMKEPELYRSHDPLHSQAVDRTASRYTPSTGLYPYSSQLKDDPLSSRPSLAKSRESTYREPPSSTLGRGSGTVPSSFLNLSHNSSSERPTERPQMRFDPYTGEPYKFDPFTGEPIRPESYPHSTNLRPELHPHSSRHF